MNSKDRDEVIKWLRLGYETFGPEGASAIADAMRVELRATAIPAWSESAHVAEDFYGAPAAESGGVALVSDEQPSSPDYRFRYGSVSQPKRRKPPMACPPTAPRDNPNWRSYVGDPSVFHCGFEGFLENRQASPDRPIGECFYDQRGRLVDDSHPYAGCKGTPDSYEADDWFEHTVLDPGGIFQSGGPAAWESFWHSVDEKRRLEEQFRQYRRDR